MTGNEELIILIEANIHIDSETLKEQTISIQKLVMKHHEVLLQRVIFCRKGTVEKTSSGKKRRKVIRDRLVNKELETLGADYA